MKPYLPGFLRKKMARSCSTSSSSSLKNSDSLATWDSSSPGFSPASNSSSSFHRTRSSSDRSWSKDALQVQKISSMGEIVESKSVLQAQKVSSMGETGEVKKQFATKLPSCNPNHELEQAFRRFDANRDGKISTLELGSILRSLGDNPSDEELLLMVKEVDRDGDGFIDLLEFILLNSAYPSSGKEDLRQAFLVFDADANGKISVEELHRVLNRLGELCTLEECGRMIRGVDIDGDGFVDFQEFCTMMTMHL